MTKTVEQKQAVENVELGFKMRELRKAKRFGQGWVATEMGISQSLLCYLEKGQRTWSNSLKQRFLKAIGEV
jgi:predicted transcriptional regulator